jgi:hypothetical protein
MAFLNGAGPASVGTEVEARKVVGTDERDRQPSSPPPSNSQAIRAELAGSSRCTAAGISTSGSTPVLALCRQLLAAGVDPDLALEVYRQGILALRVRSLRGGAALKINGKGTDFIAAKAVDTASPISFSAPALTPGQDSGVRR